MKNPLTSRTMYGIAGLSVLGLADLFAPNEGADVAGAATRLIATAVQLVASFGSGADRPEITGQIVYDGLVVAGYVTSLWAAITGRTRADRPLRWGP